MTAPIFGRDIDCGRCGTIHDSAEGCKPLELSDVVWTRRADVWRIAHIGENVTSEDLTGAIGRPFNDKLIGALWRRWQAAGFVHVVKITTAHSKKRHSGTIRLWHIQ